MHLAAAARRGLFFPRLSRSAEIMTASIRSCTRPPAGAQRATAGERAGGPRPHGRSYDVESTDCRAGPPNPAGADRKPYWQDRLCCTAERPQCGKTEIMITCALTDATTSAILQSDATTGRFSA